MGDFESSKSSGHKTASAVVCDEPCFITGVQLYSDATNAATLIIYDSATASTIGKVMFKAVANAEAGGGSGSTFETKDWTYPVECKNGIYAAISGTSAGYVVEYID